MNVSAASWQTSFQLHRVSALLWGRVVEAKLYALERAVKANFDPNQPRVPAGNSDGGQWTGDSGGSSHGPDDHLSGGTSRHVLAGGSDNDPLDDPPEVPRERPRTSRARTRVLKQLGFWLGRQMFTKRVRALLTILDQAGWLEPSIDIIRTFADPPKSLEELQRSASPSEPGYDDHHIVEKTAALREGFPADIVKGPENLVRIPRLKHWLVTGWYQIPNERYDWQSPREYLREKPWEERRRIGLDILIELGVLKP